MALNPDLALDALTGRDLQHHLHEAGRAAERFGPNVSRHHGLHAKTRRLSNRRWRRGLAQLVAGLLPAIPASATPVLLPLPVSTAAVPSPLPRAA